MTDRTLPLSDLLAHRDGEPLDPQIAEAIEDSARARAQLAQLRSIKHELNQLDPVAPEADLWEAIEKRANSPRARHLNMRYPLATAAAVFFAVAITMVVLNPFESGVEPTLQVPVVQNGDGLPGLMNRSQNLETLVRMPVDDGWNRSQQALLYRITDVDAQLIRLAERGELDTPEYTKLWRERVGLLESLVEVQRGQTAPTNAVY